MHKAIEAFPLPLKSTRNSLGMRKWHSVSHMKYFWVASGSYTPWDAPAFFLSFFFFFRLWIWCSRSVQPGNTSKVHTTTRTGCPTATVSPPPSNERTVISSSSKDRTHTGFIHSHHYTTSQGRKNKKEHNVSGRLWVTPLKMRYLWSCSSLLIKTLHSVLLQWSKLILSIIMNSHSL